MDLRPDGGLSSVIGHNNATLYLVKPNGDSVNFNTQGNDDVQPVIAGVAIKGEDAYVLGGYEAFSGIRIFSWDVGVDELKIGNAGSVPDDIMRSPDGNHMCYLISVSATEQILTCNGGKTSLTPNDYSINWVSDTGVVILARADKSFVWKSGNKKMTLDTPNVIAYQDKIIADEYDTLKIMSLDGTLLASKEGAGFSITTLRRWTLLPTGRYLFRHEPLGDTHVFTWDIKEVKVLPGFAYFANENFVVTAKDGVIHCYSLKDFHEVFNLNAPYDSLGYIKLSDDGKVMLVSGDVGNFYLYKGVNN